MKCDQFRREGSNGGDGGRPFPPLYVSTGEASKDRLAFIHILERLKTQKRTGWVYNKIPNPESISDHMYRMAVLSMLSDDPTLDMSKCVMMSLVHDLAEAHVGDIAPREGISKEEKHRREQAAMKNFVTDMLHDSPAALRIEALWKEYEEGETVEARFVKDLDKFEMASQALEYERNYGTSTLQPFFDSSIPKLQHPQVKQWGVDLLEERSQMQQGQDSKPHS
ncbi:HD domain-containing protein [Panaeolus papilionaceus]|nr:HD domain-containing protein [Panaeolus papilionaceus]